MTLLKDTHPELIDEWSPKNTINLNTLTTGSGKKVIWAGKCGHEWTSAAYKRTQKSPRGCPYCSNKVVLQGFNDLATTHPGLAQEFSEDNPMKATEIIAGTNKKLLWVCPSGHSYTATGNHRVVSSTGCPYCSGRMAFPGETDLATQSPELIKLWSDKNTLDPSTILPNSNKKAWWVCSEGHEWEAQINSVSKGSRCPYCSGRKSVVGLTDLASLRPDLVASWSDKNIISPDEVSVSSSYRATWICEKGHEWDSYVYNRSYGKDCPRCSVHISRPEDELAEFVSSLGVTIIRNDRKVISPKELDIFVVDKNIAIEFNGVYSHSSKFKSDNTYHYKKWKACHDLGIQLITVWEDEWLQKKDLVKALITHKLGLSTERKVPARKTKVSPISYESCSVFLNKHHIQGSASGTHYLGLTYGDDLVAVMVLKKSGDSLVLERYATSCNVVGGHSKLISWVRKSLSFDKIITFADLCVSDGSLYEKTGWRFDKELSPDYKYLVNRQRVHKFGYRLTRFKNDPTLEYVEGLTEKDLAQLNGLFRVYDCGKRRYVLDA